LGHFWTNDLLDRGVGLGLKQHENRNGLLEEQAVLISG
jgi:hypothetical protein